MEPKIFEAGEFLLDIAPNDDGHKKVLTFIDTACRLIREKTIKKEEDRSAYYATNYLNLLFENHPMRPICYLMLDHFHAIMMPLTAPTKNLSDLLKMAHSEMSEEDFTALEANFHDAWQRNWVFVSQAVQDNDVGPRTTMLSQVLERAPKHDDTRLFAYRTRSASLLTPELAKQVATIVVNNHELTALSAIFFIPKRPMFTKDGPDSEPRPVQWLYKLPFALVAHDKEHFLDKYEGVNYCVPLTFRLYKYGGYCKKESNQGVFQLAPVKHDWYLKHWHRQSYDPESLRGVIGYPEHDLIFPSGLDDEVNTKYKQYGTIYKMLNELVEFCGQITMTGNPMFSHVPDFFKALKKEAIDNYLRRSLENNVLKKAAAVDMQATQTFDVAKKQNLALIAKLSGTKRTSAEAELACAEKLRQDLIEVAEMDKAREEEKKKKAAADSAKVVDTESDHELKLEDLLEQDKPVSLVDQLVSGAPKITTRSAAKKSTQ